MPIMTVPQEQALEALGHAPWCDHAQCRTTLPNLRDPDISRVCRAVLLDEDRPDGGYRVQLVRWSYVEPDGSIPAAVDVIDAPSLDNAPIELAGLVHGAVGQALALVDAGRQAASAVPLGMAA